MSTETRTMSVATTLIETDEARDDWMREFNESSCFVLAPHSEHYVAFCTEDGDWYATRPINEDDQAEDGSFPDGVTVSFEGLDLPITVLHDPSDPAPAPSVVPEAAVEAAASAVRKERAFSAAAAFGVPIDDVPHCAEMIARAALTAALPLLTAAQSATREEVAEAALADAIAERYAWGPTALASRLLARFTITPKEDR